MLGAGHSDRDAITTAIKQFVTLYVRESINAITNR